MRVRVLFIALGIIGALLWGGSYSFADELQIPFAINIPAFIEEAKENGFDLNDVDGFVENKGSRVIIYTYDTVSVDNLDMLKDAAFNNMR